MATGRCVLHNGLAALAGSAVVLLVFTFGAGKNGKQSPLPQIRIIRKDTDRLEPSFLFEEETTTVDEADLNNEVTIVTGYFNLGVFQKGESRHNQHTPDLYKTWMAIFSKVNNPVVAYFDDDYYCSHFDGQRKDLLPLSQSRMVERNDLWSFKVKDKIQAIFNQRDYPVYHPNTVVPEYSSAMHAKYELLLRTIRSNPFKTRYFAWLDIGLFRDINVTKQQPFHIHLPPHFNQSKVAYSSLVDFNELGRLSDEQIFLSNTVWVCGCFFIGRGDVIAEWAKEYIQNVDYFLEHGLMNTDQQVILAILKNHAPLTSIQTYTSDNSYNPWFHLGYLCKS